MSEDVLRAVDPISCRVFFFMQKILWGDFWGEQYYLGARSDHYKRVGGVYKKYIRDLGASKKFCVAGTLGYYPYMVPLVKRFTKYGAGYLVKLFTNDL